jgi:hypothetical protein
MLSGQCLCGAVVFEIALERLALYRCHCSLCRRQSGTASNCAAVVPASAFRFVGGAGDIQSWRKPSGYRSDVCRHCGAPVPNPLQSRPAWWVPAGALDAAAAAQVVADFHLGSKAGWDDVPPAAAAYAGFPDVDEFFDLMHGARVRGGEEC